MITIKLNGAAIQISSEMTLLELANNHIDTGQCYSLALNRAFVPRAKYAACKLTDQDEVDVIQPMQGG